MDKPIFFILNDSPKRDLAGDVGVYENKEAAEYALEIDNIGDPNSWIFDSSGEVYALQRRKGSYLVEIVQKSPPEIASDDLDSILRDHGSRIGLDEKWCKTAPLDDLISAYFKRDPNPYSGWTPKKP